MSFDPMGHNTPQADLDVLMRLCRELSPVNREYTVCVEVGAWAGQSTLAMLATAGRVYSIDTWRGLMANTDTTPATPGVFEAWCKNVGQRNLLTRAFPCPGTSLEWAARWPFQVDLVFIDADHSYEAVLADMEAWWPHVKLGGLLVGHDASMQSVNKAIVEFGYDKQEADVWCKRK